MLQSHVGSWGDLDPLIGRDDELARLLDELERSRLVSVTGPGGSGKTRLAEAVVSTVGGRGRDAWFVDLSSIEDASLVAATITTTMRLEGPAARDPLDVVVEALADREAVLGLDNIEQIPGIGQVVTSLLRAAPRLRILTTSRVPLGVRGEFEVAVPTLGLPAEPTVAAVEQSPAGSLFLVRARALGRLRSIDARTAADISTLLYHLGGLPLAIELAAARTRAMSPAEIVRRLEQRGTDAIDANDGDRHRSLRAILDWTLGLLSPAERETLEAVSVCAGFDLDIAQALVPEADVVHAIESLVALGLVATSGTLETVSRFRLLETIRSTVLRGLTDERLHALEDRHAQKFFHLADDWDQTSAGGWTRDVVDRLDADADNVRRALDRLDLVDPRQSLVLGSRLAPFWQTRGRLAEGVGRFERTSALAPEPSVELARATAQYPKLAQSVLGLISFRALTDRAIELARAVADPSALIAALSYRTIIAMHEGDASAAAAAEAEVESLDLTDLDPRTRIALTDLRVSAAGAEYGEESDQYLTRSRAQFAEASNAGWAGVQAIAASNLAQILLLRGEHEEAAALADEAAEIFRRLENPAFLGLALSRRAAPLAEIGRSAEAVGATVEAAVIAESLRLPANVADSLRTAMAVALSTGQPLLAARLWGAARGMHDRGDYVLPPSDLRVGEGWLARASAAASSVAIELALRDGEAEDPLELLRALPELLRSSAPVSRAATRLRHGELTKREIEILALVGQGKSDREIAETLFISPKTASVHVANIKGKLGLQSRLEVALRARGLGLVGDMPKPAFPSRSREDRHL
jgi:predicted ATPase/DNA-binding CsgD family transcriptional regulator